MVTNLAGGLAQAGYAVDMVLAKARGKHVQAIPPEVRVVRLNAKHTFSALFGLSDYLRRERPAALLAAKDRAIKVAVLARWWSGVSVPLAGRLGTTVSAALKGRSQLKKWIWYGGMRRFYRHVDRIIAVSDGVAEDIARIARLPAQQIAVVRNPVITPNLFRLAAEPVDHPWLTDGSIPVIVAAGRMTRQKDFPTLIRAFSQLRKTRPCRLIILGEGERGREKLEALTRELDLVNDVDMPGFKKNPYPYFARASLFVLSSAWEGSPNVLTEALAVGTPVVSTDCPSGPREILQDGRYGKLVPVGDAAALARAMKDTLDAPLPTEQLKDAVALYTVEQSAARYLEALGLKAAGYDVPQTAVD